LQERDQPAWAIIRVGRDHAGTYQAARRTTGLSSRDPDRLFDDVSMTRR
jgi:hypothetical protein